MNYQLIEKNYMATQNDPLTSLFINDAKSVDREQLASLDKPFLSFDQETKEFIFLPAFREIKGNMEKIEILLTGAKARSLYLNELDGLEPGKIISFEIMPAGSCKSSLKKLYDDRKIKKQDNRYVIPAYRIPELLKQFIK